MPNRLSRRATLLLLGVAFGLTFTVQLLLSDGSSAPEREGRAGTLARPSPRAPAAAPKLSVVAGGDGAGAARAAAATPSPASPRRPCRIVEAAPTVEPEPTPAATVQPAPTAAPRYIAPRPQPTPKPAAPKPTPTPTAPPPSGEFDTSGES